MENSFIGKEVISKAFGKGVVESQEGSTLFIKFYSGGNPKPFSYPRSFEKFLEFVDEDAKIESKLALGEIETEENQRKEKALQEEIARKERLHKEATKKTSGAGAAENFAVHSFSDVGSFCEGFRQDLYAEICFLKQNGGKRQKLVDGKLIEAQKGRYTYSFEADSELNYPENTMIKIWIDNDSIPGMIAFCEDFTVTIITEINLGTDVASIEFSAEPWELIEGLRKRLEFIRTSYSEIVKDLVTNGKNKISYASKIVRGQDKALEMSLSQPITFIWGPPGTGKTETLSRIALEHLRKGKRVLMLSYSNVSVDGAILRVFKNDTGNYPGKLVRYGYSRDEFLNNHQYLTSFKLTLYNHTDLLKENINLRKELKTVKKASVRYVEIKERLLQIKNVLKKEEKNNVLRAEFVATTVSKAVVDKTLYEDRYDVVIFDEASMAYIPQVVFAASLAKTHFICMGDFAQLPPIVQSGTTSMLNADIFKYCGITDAVERGCGHEWLCMLNKQYRMHPQIADFSSYGMYHSLLVSAEGMEEKRKYISFSDPMAGRTIGIADLSGMMSVCSKTADGSHVNPLSAFITFGLALQSAYDHETGIITPYHAQARLLHAMARDASERDEELKPISCATVHQFQGSEKDVIIYDAVDCYRQPYPGQLLTSMTNNSANRLFNVALTRARGKFVTVVNVSYMENKNLSKNLLFGKLINRYKNSESCICSEDFDGEFSGGGTSFYRWCKSEEGNREFVNDIRKAQKEIRIDIAGSMFSGEIYVSEIASALNEVKKRGVKITIRTENKNVLPKTIRSMAIQHPFVMNPICIIDKSITWFGEPLSEANFIAENEIIPTKFRPIIRFEGKHTANALYGFMEMNRTTDSADYEPEDDDGENFASYISSNMRCRKCGRAMKLKRGKNGFFIACSGYPDCQNTGRITPDLVEDYFDTKGPTGMHCPQDGFSLEAKAGQYGVYVQCCSMGCHKFRLDEI